jgi:hypothetical protein
MVYYPRRHEPLTTYDFIVLKLQLVKEYRHKRGGKQAEREVKQLKWVREWGAEGAKFWMWRGLYIILCPHSPCIPIQ